MINNKIKIIFICCILFTFMVGCSTKPVYYSKSEVKNYVKDVFGKEYKMVDSKSYEDQDDEEKNMIYEYIFENKQGNRFSVYAKTYHIGIDASTTAFYDKSISDDYIRSVYLEKEYELKEISEKSSLQIDINETPYINIHVDNYNQLKEAGKIVSDIDAAMDLKYNYNNADKSNDYFSIYLYYSHDFNGETEETEIGSIYLTNNEKERWTDTEAYEELERLFVSKAKKENNEGYNIPESLWYKYPASTIHLTSINDNVLPENESFKFLYDEENSFYWIYNLDPCQDFQGFPYLYTNKGKFRYLVEMLGGTYESNDWTATWNIGEDTWNAELKTHMKNDSNYFFDDFIVFCNGKKLKLSDSPKCKKNGTISGRAFTIEDLELLLNVDIYVDQSNFTAKMVLNNKY